MKKSARFSESKPLPREAGFVEVHHEVPCVGAWLVPILAEFLGRPYEHVIMYRPAKETLDGALDANLGGIVWRAVVGEPLIEV